jgi:hypothetical protein
MIDKRVICCVPVKVAAEVDPAYPMNETRTTYRRVTCPMCKEDMWLGAKSEQLMKKQNIEALCMICAYRKYGDEVETAAHVVLSDPTYN